MAVFFRQIGLAVGVSVLGAIQVARLGTRANGAVPDTGSLLLGTVEDPTLRAALAGSIHDAWLGAIALVVLGLVLSTQMTAWQTRPAADSGTVTARV